MYKSSGWIEKLRGDALARSYSSFFCIYYSVPLYFVLVTFKFMCFGTPIIVQLYLESAFTFFPIQPLYKSVGYTCIDTELRRSPDSSIMCIICIYRCLVLVVLGYSPHRRTQGNYRANEFQDVDRNKKCRLSYYYKMI